VRKLAPSDGWQTTAEAVARRVVEDEQEDAVEDEEVVQEEDLSDEEAGGLCRSSEVGGASVGGTGTLARDRAGWRGGLKSLGVNECE
jgi:hypothetical protein